MPIVTSDIELAQNALRRAGLGIIQSFAEQSEKAEQVNAIYFPKRALFLSLYPWTFTKKFVGLNKLTAAPPAQWSAQFRLPADRVANPQAYFLSADEGAPPFKDFELATDNVVMANADALWCRYPYLAPERLWPAYFVDFAECALAHLFLTALSENAKKIQELKIEAWGTPDDDGEGGLYRRAKKRDAHYTRTRPLQPDGGVLIQARRGALSCRG